MTDAASDTEMESGDASSDPVNAPGDPANAPGAASRAAAAQPVSLSAPGKLFLAGEYAVLEPGRMALVAAVDSPLRLSLRALATRAVELWHRPSKVALLGELTTDARAPIAWAHGVPGELRFAARAAEVALRLCAEEGVAPRGFAATFENDFELGFSAAASGEIVPPGEIEAIASGEAAASGAVESDASEAPAAPKPGLGGSAAATVLAVRAAALAQGRALAPEETLALAAAAHWVEQGGSGSGGDVAASALGGLLEVRMRRAPESAASLWASPAKELLAHPLVEARPHRSARRAAPRRRLLRRQRRHPRAGPRGARVRRGPPAEIPRPAQSDLRLRRNLSRPRWARPRAFQASPRSTRA